MTIHPGDLKILGSGFRAGREKITSPNTLFVWSHLIQNLYLDPELLKAGFRIIICINRGLLDPELHGQMQTWIQEVKNSEIQLKIAPT